MESFIGKWQLIENKNLEKFLEFYGYSWFSIKAALIANVDVYFLKNNDPNSLKRIIDSTFLKGEEIYDFTGKVITNSENLKKSHTIENGEIFSKVILDNKNWKEHIVIKGDKLILKRFFNYNGEDLSCEQIFVKTN